MIRSSRIDVIFPDGRTYESCIVRSELDGTPISKYAVITNNAIYVTENPHPKTLAIAVDLETIVSVGLVSQYHDREL